MRAYATLRGPDGSARELVHGDIIGRLSAAALPLDDARVSEAHAMLSLRECELRIIALRGGLAVGGRPVNEATLSPGLDVTLARGVQLRVLDVHLPERVLGIEARGLARQALPPVASVVTAGGPRVVAGYVEQAAAQIWCTGTAWRARVGATPARDLLAGQTLALPDHRLHVVEIPLGAAGQVATRAGGGVAAPIRIRANFDTVHLHPDGAIATTLGGIHARIVSELVALAGPIHWTGLAELLWPGDPEPKARRRRFDVTMSRLRRKLRDANIRTDLVRTDGSGQVELMLYPHDVVEDRT